jgi:uncharacterized protein YdeI (YjbR/CyaY-like superfamily)
LKNHFPTTHLAFKDRDQWRRWLEQNHDRETQAWLVICRTKFKDQGLALAEAVEEALCFGWIDGTLQPLDDRRYALRFSPRAPHSIWSVNNIRRAEKLLAQGRMTEAGLQRILESRQNGEWQAALRRESVDSIPHDLEIALQKTDGALAAYRSLPASRKKQYLYWLESAKREATRQRSIRKIVEQVLKE